MLKSFFLNKTVETTIGVIFFLGLAILSLSAVFKISEIAENSDPSEPWNRTFESKIRALPMTQPCADDGAPARSTCMHWSNFEAERFPDKSVTINLLRRNDPHDKIIAVSVNHFGDAYDGPKHGGVNIQRLKWDFYRVFLKDEIEARRVLEARIAND